MRIRLPQKHASRACTGVLIPVALPLSLCFASDLKRVFILLYRRLRVEVLDGNSSLDAAERVAGRVGEAANAAGLVHERAFPSLFRRGQVAQVVDEHVALAGADDESIAGQGQGEDALAFLRRGRRGLLRLARVPPEQATVPPAAEEGLRFHVRHHAATHAAVRAERVARASGQVDCGHVLVHSDCECARVVCIEAAVEHCARVFHLQSAHIVRDVVQSERAVPAGRQQQVAAVGPHHLRNAVARRLVQRELGGSARHVADWRG